MDPSIWRADWFQNQIEKCRVQRGGWYQRKCTCKRFAWSLRKKWMTSSYDTETRHQLQHRLMHNFGRKGKCYTNKNLEYLVCISSHSLLPWHTNTWCSRLSGFICTLQINHLWCCTLNSIHSTSSSDQLPCLRWRKASSQHHPSMMMPLLRHHGDGSLWTELLKLATALPRKITHPLELFLHFAMLQPQTLVYFKRI